MGLGDAAQEQEPTPQSASTLWVAIVVIGLLSLVLFNMFAQPPLPPPAARSTVLSVTIMLAAAATAIGALLGFLFGIPRSVQDPRAAAVTMTPEAADQQAAYERGSYEVNTNLEQISDWLTKILVGVGLVQLGSLAEPSGRLVDSITDGLGGRAIDRLMVGGILVYFTIYGFLGSYLLTRLQLRRAFTRAEAHSMVARTLRSSPPTRMPTGTTGSWRTRCAMPSPRTWRRPNGSSPRRSNGGSGLASPAISTTS